MMIRTKIEGDTPDKVSLSIPSWLGLAGLIVAGTTFVWQMNSRNQDEAVHAAETAKNAAVTAAAQTATIQTTLEVIGKDLKEVKTATAEIPLHSQRLNQHDMRLDRIETRIKD